MNDLIKFESLSLDEVRKMCGMSEEKFYIPRVKINYGDEFPKGEFIYDENDTWKSFGKDMTGTVLFITRQLRNFDEKLEKSTIRSNEFMSYAEPIKLFIDQEGKTIEKTFNSYKEAKAYDEKLKLEINLYVYYPELDKAKRFVVKGASLGNFFDYENMFVKDVILAYPTKFTTETAKKGTNTYYIVHFEKGEAHKNIKKYFDKMQEVKKALNLVVASYQKDITKEDLFSDELMPTDSVAPQAGCKDCGSPMKISQAGKPYCSATCWLNKTDDPSPDVLHDDWGDRKENF